METSTRRGLVVGAVAIGSLLLIGPLTYFLVVNMVESVVAFVGVGPVNGWAGLVVILGAGLIALETASVVATVRIRGYEALRRGSESRIFLRHAALVAPVTAAIVLIADFVADAIQWGLARNEIGILGASLVVIVAVVWAAVRFVTFYQRGHQRVS